MSAAAPIQREVGATAALVSPDAAAAPYEAASRAGNSAVDFGVQLAKAQQEKDLTAARLDATQQLDALQDKFRTDTDPDTMAERYSAAAAEIGKGAGRNLWGTAATSFGSDFGFMSESRLRNIKDVAFGRQVEQANANSDALAETTSRSAAYAANPAERASNIDTFKKSIDGLVSSGMLSPESGQKKFQVFKERLSLYDGHRDVFLDPKAALKNLANPKYLSDLDPLQRMQLLNSADAEIKQREREARQRQSEARVEASLAAEDLHDVVASGLPVAQAVRDRAIHAAQASGDPRAMARVTGLLHAEGFADSMRGANPREVDTGIEALTARANAQGADVGIATALTAARKFKENMNNGLSHDPLMWADGQGVIGLSPLKLDGSDAPEAFATRQQQAGAVSRRYGVPVAPLTQAESETLKTRLDKDQDPDSRLRTLQTVVHGFGANALPVLGHIGASDPALANAGTLVASGNAYVGTARDVLAGHSLLSSKTNENLRPSNSGLAAAGVNPQLAAFALLPNTRTSVLAGADAIYAAQAARLGLTGGDAVNSSKGRALLQKSVQLAAGARYDGDGTQWGGTGEYRRNAVLVPGNIKADDFEDLVHHFQPADLAAASVSHQSPAWEGGAAPANLVHRTWLISGGNGVYGLSATDPSKGAMTPVLDKSGAPFRFRFNTALVAMQSRTKAGQ